jgi:sulfate adenylyltransferase subunit 1 (EFTu-like GTPase family)
MIVQLSVSPPVVAFSLIDALAAVPELEAPYIVSDLMQFVVTGFYNVKPGKVITGHLCQGELRPGEDVQFFPSGATATIKSIEVMYKTVERVAHSRNIGSLLRNLKGKPIVGDLMVCTGNSGNFRQFFVFTVRVTLLNNCNLVIGARLLLYCRSSRANPVTVRSFVPARNEGYLVILKADCPEIAADTTLQSTPMCCAYEIGENGKCCMVGHLIELSD